MNALNKVSIYVKKSLKALYEQPSLLTLKNVVSFFPDWVTHLNGKRNSVDDKKPWLSFGAIEFIDKIVRPEMVVFEYGSGGSTLFWAQKVKNVISIEHNKEWYSRMKEEFEKQQIGNIEYTLIEAEADEGFSAKNKLDPKNYLSTDKEFEGKNFKSYVEAIDKKPYEFYDVIVVDGRARPSCILHSIDRIRVNGYLIVDNTERDYYLSAFQFDKNKWNQWTFYGPVPYTYDFTQTTIFQKKEA